MDCVNAQNPAEAWLSACSLLASKGKKVGNNVELDNLIVLINKPLMDNLKISQVYLQTVGQEYFDRVNQLMFSTKPLKWKTSYRSRLVAWNNEFDQLNEVISIMQKKPGSKTLTCIVNNPPKDLRRVHTIAASMPCLTAIDFRIRNNLLSMTAYFRSQDVFRIGYPDYINMGKFLKETHAHILSEGTFAKEKSVGLGEITFHIVSAFIRQKDMKVVKEIINLKLSS